jgi:sulfane dehydrogenase subunit SoxC
LFAVTTVWSGFLAGCKRQASADEQDGARRIGKTWRAYRERSEFGKAARAPPARKILEVGSSYTRAETLGIITPPALHYQRLHSGLPTIDPSEHRLLIHGMVDRPLIFTWTICGGCRRFRASASSSVRATVISGYGRKEDSATVQLSHGLASCSDWTGVGLGLLLSGRRR